MQDTVGSSRNPRHTRWDHLPSFYLVPIYLTQFRHQSYKEKPTLFQTYPHFSFTRASLPTDLLRSSPLRAPRALPEGNSVCSEPEAPAAVLARLPGTHSQAPRGRQQLRPEAMPLPGASCCLEGHKPLESVLENKNLWCIVPSNKDSPAPKPQSAVQHCRNRINLQRENLFL